MKTCALAFLFLVTSLSSIASDKKILLIAGPMTHGPGDHEFRAGCLILQKRLNDIPGISAEVHSNGWPQSDVAFEGADAVFIYSDGGGGHPAIQGERPKLIDALMGKGVGFGFVHYAVEVPTGEHGKRMQDWIGGYYEHEYSVNPFWAPDFKNYPTHPITNGVQPFQLTDEWYFNMRFREDNVGIITPILVAQPDDDVRNGPYVWPHGPYDHIVAASGKPEVMMWTYDRPNGGRSFGFTGGHKHANWENDNFRKIVLNSILWIAKVEVPKNGVQTTITGEELKANLDPKEGK